MRHTEDESTDGNEEEKLVFFEYLDVFLKENSHILTIMGVFGAFVVYFTQRVPVERADINTAWVYVSGMGIILLLFLVLIAKSYFEIIKNGGLMNLKNIPLLVFMILLGALFIPVIELLSEFKRPTLTILGILVVIATLGLLYLLLILIGDIIIKVLPEKFVNGVSLFILSTSCILMYTIGLKIFGDGGPIDGVIINLATIENPVSYVIVVSFTTAGIIGYTFFIFSIVIISYDSMSG